ncbi:uncharacterized protein LOC144121981 isoform X1 [Amblyomma americanum]
MQQKNDSLLAQVASLQRCLESKIFHLEAHAVCLTGTGASSQHSVIVNEMEQSLSHGVPGDPQCHQKEAVDPLIVEKPPTPECAALAAVLPEAKKPDFTYLQDRMFHLTAGIIISSAQAAKILANKKATLVCEDTAQAVWTSEVLATRSVSGMIAPKKRALGEKPKQPLTPQKVDVVTLQ